MILCHKRILIPLATVLLLTGCQQPTPQVVSPQPTEKSPGDHRFVQVDGNLALNLPGSLALDTQTGQLCRTYNWTSLRDRPTLPMCLDLYKTTTVGTNLPKVGDMFNGSRVLKVEKIK
jgi:hypothetical protein